MGFDKILFTRLLRFGTPAGIQFTLDIGAFTLFIMLVGRMGELELAVTNIALSINMLAFLPMIGISIATTTLVGQYIGKKDLSAAEKSTYSSLKIALLYMGSTGVLFILFPEQLLSLFRRSPEEAADFLPMVAYGRRILLLIAFYGFFDAMNIIFSGALKGAGDTRFTMWAAVIVAWVFFVPPIYLIVEVFNQGVLLAWGWATIYIIVIGTVFCFRFRSGKWKTIDLLARKETTPSIPPVIDEHLPHDQPFT
jgi:MATE family multidrug resistance protein